MPFSGTGLCYSVSILLVNTNVMLCSWELPGPSSRAENSTHLGPPVLLHDREQLRDVSSHWIPLPTVGVDMGTGDRGGMRSSFHVLLLGGVTARGRTRSSFCFVSMPSSLLLGATQVLGSGDTNGSLVMFLNNTVPEKSAGLIILALYLMKVSEAWWEGMEAWQSLRMVHKLDFLIMVLNLTFCW